MDKQYRVNTFNKPVNIQVRVPGSKSITNRVLLIAALSDGECVLRGCGMSDDSRVFIEALISLGFDVGVEDCDVTIGGRNGFIPCKQADVYVGSAGTAARFLTAMMGLSDGVYEVTSSEQMKTRPMRPLLEALELLGARFTFHEQEYAFPFTVEGAGHSDREKNTSANDKADSSEKGVEPTERPTPTIPLNIDSSSQFLSALLLCAPMLPHGLTITLTGTRNALSYVNITEKMMRDFAADEQDSSNVNMAEKTKHDFASDVQSGSNINLTEKTMRDFATDEQECSPDHAISPQGDEYNPCEVHCKRTSDEQSEEANRAWTSQRCIIARHNNQYTISPAVRYHAREYDIEPDVSAACYFYAMAAVNGGSARVRGVNRANTQGDMRFLEVLEKMGCDVSAAFSKDDITVSKEPDTPLHCLDIDMSDFSDQTMTLAVIAPFADSPTTISGVGHIRNQESDRIHGIVTELTRLGIRCEEYPDGLKIYPLAAAEKAYERESGPEIKETVIDTYNDHRMAMSFAVLGTRIPGVVIDNPDCSRKTFDGFFDLLSHITFSSEKKLV